jgi:hypothetical protein
LRGNCCLKRSISFFNSNLVTSVGAQTTLERGATRNPIALLRRPIL